VKRTRNQLHLLTALFCAIISIPAAPATAQEADIAQPYHGTWTGEVSPPGGHPILIQLAIDQRSDEDVRVTMHSTIVNTWFDGSIDEHTGRLIVNGYIGGDLVTLALEMDGDALAGTSTRPPGMFTLSAVRTGRDAHIPDRIVVDLDRPIPHAIHKRGLGDEDSNWLNERALQLCREIGMVGLSIGIVRDGEVHDVRSFGWQNYATDTPASDKTMYRWASVAKTLTAVAIMQLVEAGKIDLDEDIRTLLPEFPEKRWPVTAEQLLLHHAGVVHYQAGRVKQLRPDGSAAFPHEDAVVAMDLFKESNLLFEPGTRYGYSTPGYVVLGALAQKAAGKPFHVFVDERVCDPIGMTSMQPDFKSVDIPNRSHGYLRMPDRSIVDSGDSDVSWKLAAGGWISTITDFARYATAVGSTDLLSAESWEQMWTPQNPSNGETSTYGYGFGVGEIAGERMVSHSGGQRKCSSFMLCVPERDFAVVIMCNTERLGVSRLAREIAQRLMAEPAD